jgi:hypothetical protein
VRAVRGVPIKSKAFNTLKQRPTKYKNDFLIPITDYVVLGVSEGGFRRKPIYTAL